jgi:hypothetical protein
MDQREGRAMRSHPIAVIGVTLLLAVVSQRPGVGQGTSQEGSTRATVTVAATYPWVDSGLVVRKGERLSFEASGTIHWGSKPEQVSGPEGHGAKPGKLGVGGLIGRVGYSGKAFPIGNTRMPVSMPHSGKLFLGINDFIFKDNAGSFVVKVYEPR